jgi:hypothetical protein
MYIFILGVHVEPEDPCTSGVLTALSRLAEALGEDFLPHVDCLLPVLLRQANTQAETNYLSSAQEDDMEDDDYIVTTSPEGETVRVNSEILREKSNALELLSSVAHALGSGITTVGSNESTTGDWTSYGETMLELACNLLLYEYSEDVRIAAATMIPPLVRAFRGTHQVGNDYSPKYVENAIPPLLAALAYETEPDALGAMFTATSEVVLAAPDAFTAENAATFVKAVSEQIEGIKQSIETRATLDEESRTIAAEQDEVTLEYISRALQAVIRTTGPNFPIQRLFQALGSAIHGELGIRGDREWGLRMVADLVEFASPNSVAWTAGFLPTVREGLRSEVMLILPEVIKPSTQPCPIEPTLRRICVYTTGAAALVPEGLFANFYRCQSGFVS